MSRNKGMPSGLNKSGGTGVPSSIKSRNLKKDQELTQKYTEDDNKPAGQVRSHPNRNVDKSNPTNAGGYKS